MTSTVKTLGELMADYEAEHLSDVARVEARINSPAERARLALKKQDELARGIRLGWYDKDGNPVASSGDESDNDEADSG